MAKQKNGGQIGFILYNDSIALFDKLSDGDAGQLVKAIFHYKVLGEKPNLNPAADMAFTAIQNYLDRDAKSFQDKCEKNAENGRKGGLTTQERTRRQGKANQANASNGKANQANASNGKANQADNDNDNDSEDDIKNNNCSPGGEPSASECDALFEELWEEYPLKRGKARVSDSDKKKIYAIGRGEMLRAIERYKEGLLIESWRKPQNGSTFFHGGYIDYLDTNYSPPKRGNFTGRLDNDSEQIQNSLIKKGFRDAES